VLYEDYSTLTTENTRVTFLHAVSDAPSVDVYVGGTLVIAGINFAEFRSVDLPAGLTGLYITPSGDPITTLLRIDRPLLAQKAYFVVPVGLLGDDSVRVRVMTTNVNLLMQSIVE
jgi:hypothetical protein